MSKLLACAAYYLHKYRNVINGLLTINAHFLVIIFMKCNVTLSLGSEQGKMTGTAFCPLFDVTAQ